MLMFFLSMASVYAYFTATASKQQSELTTAIIRVGFTSDTGATIDSNSITDSTKIVPGETLEISGAIQNIGNSDIYTILHYELFTQKVNESEIQIVDKYYTFSGSTMVEINDISNPDDSIQAARKLTANATTMLGETVGFNLNHKFDFYDYDNTYQNATARYLITAHAIQVANLDDGVQATQLIAKFNIMSQYQQVEYIEATGTEYIDINYLYQVNDQIEVDFMITSNTGAIQGIFGNGNQGGIGTVLYLNADNILTSTIGGTLGQQFYKYQENPISLNTKYNVKYQGSSMYLNNEIVLSVQNSLNNGTQSDFSIFRRWGTNSMVGKIYKFSISRDNNYIINLIPCYRKKDGKVGMLDTVNNIFYTNNGTGDFLKGNNI